MSSAKAPSRSGVAIFGGPHLLRTLLLRESLIRFAGGEAFLVGIMVLADLFSSMWKLLAMEAPFVSVLLWVAEGVPAHMTEVLPIALLFGITLSLAEMHADGELLVICGSGISVQSLSLPIMAFAALIAGAMFFANDWITIPSSTARDALYASMTGQNGPGRQVSNIAILSKGGTFVYRVGSYDPAAKRISNVDIVERNAAGQPLSRILAPQATWAGDRWSFREARIFSSKENGEWTETRMKDFSRPELNEDPGSFGIIREKPGLMKTGELATSIRALEKSGLPSAEARTELQKRFSFLLTPLIVCGLSVSFAGLFRKNSLLMSLLFSLATATVYYVAQMLGALSAKTGWLSPALGVWSVSIVFLVVSVIGFLKART
ncbi:MAG: LptF/LptG family permease [Spirochaetales bacterium]